MPTLWGQIYTRSDLLRRVGDMRRLAGVQPIELSDGRERGGRGVNLRNAAGLEFTVITDRGMSLTDLRFHGVPCPSPAASKWLIRRMPNTPASAGCAHGRRAFLRPAA